MSRPGRRWAALAGLGLCLCLLSACINPGSDGNKAGSRRPVVLSLANTAYGPGASLTRFAEVVDRLSGGEVRIEVVNAFGSYAADAQIQAVRAVAAGEMDMGLVGSSTFDSTGVTSLEPLSAPLLIDSYALENAVLADPLADRLLEGLSGAGVTGMGMGPGHFQLPITRDRALLDVGDWQGVSFGTYPSAVQDKAIRALGARPFWAFGINRAHALDTGEIQGFNLGLPAYGGSDLPTKAPYVAVNVRLWASIEVTIGNPARIGRLSDQQRGWLKQAAADAEAYAASLVVNESDSIRGACDQGARLVTATADQLAALRAAFAPLYAELRSNPETNRAIDEIQKLASITAPESAPDLPSVCVGRS